MTAGNNISSLVADTPKTARATASRNRLNTTLVAVIVTLVAVIVMLVAVIVMLVAVIVTLVAVIVMLVVLVYPCEFLDFFVHLAPFGQTTAIDEEAMMLTRMILNALQLSNFALNFFLYCTLNAQFRRAFVDWFCRRGRHRRDVRRAALGADAAGRPRRGDDVVRLNAVVRHPARHDDVRANQLRSSSNMLLLAMFEVTRRHRRLEKIRDDVRANHHLRSGSVGGARSQGSSASDVGPKNNSTRPSGSNNAIAVRVSGSRGSHFSNVRSLSGRRSGSPVL